MTKTVLLTGFEPFHEHTTNPSQLIAERLDGEIISGAKVFGLTLPVIFGEDTKRVFPAIEELKPAAIIALGLRGGSDSVDVEMFAINHRSEGNDTLSPIVPDGPAAYFATIDVDRVGKAIGQRSGAPVRRNGYAGSYLCNHVFYQTLHYTHVRQNPARVGFLHIAQAAEHAAEDSPAIALDRMIEAVRAAIAESVD
jgi:pyroglutamyl-peptidase